MLWYDMRMLNGNLDKALWLSLIIRKVAVERGIYQREAFAYLKETGALEFLVRNYGVEHLENSLNVLEDIRQFVSLNRRVVV
jgi:hypothetical protein